MKKQNILAAAIVLAATGASTTASAVPFVGDYEEATSAFALISLVTFELKKVVKRSKMRMVILEHHKVITT